MLLCCYVNVAWPSGQSPIAEAPGGRVVEVGAVSVFNPIPSPGKDQLVPVSKAKTLAAAKEAGKPKRTRAAVCTCGFCGKSSKDMGLDKVTSKQAVTSNAAAMTS